MRDRWTITVALLVALTSLPTLAAISAGTATLRVAADGPPGTTPFFAQRSGVAVVIVPAQPPSGVAPAPRDAPRRRGAGAAAVRGERGSPSGRKSARRAAASSQRSSASARRSSSGGPAARTSGRPSGRSSSGASRPSVATPPARSSTCPAPGRLGWRQLVPDDVTVPGLPESGTDRCS